MLDILLPIVLLVQSPAPPAEHVLDGRFEEWDAVPVAGTLEDDLVSAFRIDDDPGAVHVMVELARPATLQGLDRELRLEIDRDGNDRTGVTGTTGMKGVDVVVLFSPRDARDGDIGSGSGLLVAERSGITETTTDGLGVVAMPTHGNDRFEIRLDRESAFRGRSFDLQVVTVSPGGIATGSDVVTHDFATRRQRTEREIRLDPAAESRGIRVSSWNGERGALFESPTAFARTFEAVLPDIVLLQELPSGSRMNLADLEEWFNRLEGDRTWSGVLSGGNLPVAVLSPHPMKPVPGLERISGLDPRGTTRQVRAVGGLAEIDGRSVLALSIHLKCCGRLGSSEDQKRRAEVDAIHEAVRTVLEDLTPDVVVIGGDFNLVGTRTVLDRLCEGLAPGGGDLVVSRPLRPAGDATTTWEKPGQAFVPGQLDFILVGGASGLENAVVVDPAQLGRSWLRRHGIPAQAPSDHLPINVDILTAPDP